MRWEKIQPAGLHWGRRLNIGNTYIAFWGKYWFKHFKGSFSLSPLLVIYSPLMEMKCESPYCNYKYKGIWQWFKYTYLTKKLHPINGPLELSSSNRIYRWYWFTRFTNIYYKEDKGLSVAEKYWDKILSWSAIHCYQDILDANRNKIDWFKVYMHLDNNADLKFFKKYEKEIGDYPWYFL